MMLSSGPRFYGEECIIMRQLEKKELVKLTGARSAEGSREWTITDAGRIALEAHESGEP